MYRTGFSLCVLLSLAMDASASRMHVAKHFHDRKQSGGNHKCTITWKNTRSDPAVVSSVSFAVPNCRIQCTRTFTDNAYDNVFKKGFIPVETRSGYCSCVDASTVGSGEDPSTGQEVLKFPGGCSAHADASAQCWNDYKTLSTDSLEEQFGKDTLKITHNQEFYAETEFNYDEIECETDGCKGNPDCFSATLPSLMAGRTAAEKKLIGKLLKKIADGDLRVSDLNADVQELVGGLTQEDKEDVLFSSLVPEEYEAGQFTVGALKNMYEEKLDGTLISVDHMLKVAGYDPVNGLGEVVTPKGFKKFLEPDCD